MYGSKKTLNSKATVNNGMCFPSKYWMLPSGSQTVFVMVWFPWLMVRTANDRTEMVVRNSFAYESRKRVASTCTAFLPISLAIVVWRLSRMIMAVISQI